MFADWSLLGVVRVRGLEFSLFGFGFWGFGSGFRIRAQP